MKPRKGICRQQCYELLYAALEVMGMAVELGLMLKFQIVVRFSVSFPSKFGEKLLTSSGQCLQKNYQMFIA